MIELKKRNHEVFPIIVPDVHLGLKSINFFLVKSSQSLTLIDAGLNNNDCYDALVNTLNLNGFSLTDLTDIILTHHHIDHVGLVDRITSTHQIPVYVHPRSIPRLRRDVPFLQMRVEFFTNLYEQMGCVEVGKKQINYLKQSIKKNKDLAIKANLHPFESNQINDFEIIEVPGHAPDQIALFDKTRSWLVSGDLLLNHISSNALVEPDQNGKRMHTIIDHMDSLKKCLSLPIHLVFPGHGTLIENPMDLIQKRLNGIEEKAVRLMKLIHEGISTGNELAQTYYKNIYDKQFSLVMSEIIGHLDYLEVQGRIRKELKEGVWHYSI